VRRSYIGARGRDIRSRRAGVAPLLFLYQKRRFDIVNALWKRRPAGCCCCCDSLGRGMVVSLRVASPHSALVVVCLMFWDLDRKIGPAPGGALPPLGGVASKIYRSSPPPRFHHVLPPCSSCIWWLAKLPRSLGCSDTSPHGAESGPSPTSLRRKVYSHTHTLLNIYMCVCVSRVLLLAQVDDDGTSHDAFLSLSTLVPGHIPPPWYMELDSIYSTSFMTPSLVCVCRVAGPLERSVWFAWVRFNHLLWLTFNARLSLSLLRRRHLCV
jgi:hypothetical protein